MKIIKFCLLLFCLTSLVSCGQVNNGSSLNNKISGTFSSNNSVLAETPTPKIIKKLNQQLEQYKPQVEILSPQRKQIFDQTSISVQLKVDNLPIFKDERLKLGNHLSLIVDNEPAQNIYDLTDSVVLENLTPGTHSIRVFATRPWGESFKNNGAYAQTTFSVLTETNNNSPEPNLPLLTYGNPTGTYSAEPFLLDFYLTNAPLHGVAKNDPELLDWQIKATVNGDSFLLENWQPVYLTGLNRGENWIQLELIDEAGNNIENAFNNTVRVITYDPQQTDTLSKLVTNKISLAEAQSIVEQNYYVQPVGKPELIEPTTEIKQPEFTELDTTDKEIEPAKEYVLEDKNKSEISTAEDNNAIANSNLETEQQSKQRLTFDDNVLSKSTKEISKQPLIIPAPAIPEIEQATQSIGDNQREIANSDKSIESSESKQMITIEAENLDSSETITAIEIPQSESVEITEDKIAISIPQTETSIEPEIEPKTPVWWRKLLVSLRKKLEGLIKTLPSEA